MQTEASLSSLALSLYEVEKQASYTAPKQTGQLKMTLSALVLVILFYYCPGGYEILLPREPTRPALPFSLSPMCLCPASTLPWPAPIDFLSSLS